MLLGGEVDKVGGRVVFLVVWLTVAGLVLVVWAGGVMVVGGELRAALEPIVASVTGVVV